MIHVWLPCSLSTCFFCPLSIFDHLSWGKEGWSLCLSCICLLAMHTLFCVTFSLPPGDRGMAATSACDSSWTFLFTFFRVNSRHHSTRQLASQHPSFVRYVPMSSFHENNLSQLPSFVSYVTMSSFHVNSRHHNTQQPASQHPSFVRYVTMSSFNDNNLHLNTPAL